MFNGILTFIDNIWEQIKQLYRVLKPSRFSIIVSLFVALILIITDQGQDVLRSITEANSQSHTQILLFYISLLLWAINSWYWARTMLKFSFYDSCGEQVIPSFNYRVYIPRILGVLPFIIVAYCFYKSDTEVTKPLIFIITTLIMGVLFLLFMITRVNFLYKLSSKLKSKKHILLTKIINKLDFAPKRLAYEVKYRAFTELPLSAKLMVGLLIFLTILLFVLFLFSIKMAVVFGTASIIFFAAASWIAFGSILVYFGSKYSFPVITLLFIWAVVLSAFNDNHKIRYTNKVVTQKPNLKDNFKEWVRKTPSNNPYFIIAAEGGGIRAAYTSGLFLSKLQDSNSKFGNNIYAISGVSGGSLGATAFVAMLKIRNNQQLICKNGNSFSECSKALFSKDFLSPAVAYTLYPDLLQRFIPKGFERFDRSLALEKGWELAWNTIFNQSHTNTQFSDSFLTLWDSNATLPNLFLNSTWVEHGKRVITSNINIDKEIFSDSIDLLKLLKRDIPISTAVHNSARFSYVSPAGRVYIPSSGKNWGHIVDGGYFENSGASTAYNILQNIAKIAKNRIPVVIVITNDPNIKESCYKTTNGCKANHFLNELGSPIKALLATRDARASYARSEIKNYVKSLGGIYIEVGLCKNRGPLPLGWILSDEAKENIDNQLSGYFKSSSKELGKPFNPLNIAHLKVLEKIVQRGCHIKTLKIN